MTEQLSNQTADQIKIILDYLILKKIISNIHHLSQVCKTQDCNKQVYYCVKVASRYRSLTRLLQANIKYSCKL